MYIRLLRFALGLCYRSMLNGWTSSHLK